MDCTEESAVHLGVIQSEKKNLVVGQERKLNTNFSDAIDMYIYLY